jgi:hypothetical protein
MNDLKPIGKQRRAPKVKTTSDAISLAFGLDKCAKTVLKKEKLVHQQNIIIDINRKI